MAAPGKVTLQILRQSEDSIRVTPFRDVSALESTVKTSRICPFHSSLVADRAREVLGILARANNGVPGLMPSLVRSGRAIWMDLLPPFLKERLAEARGADLLLHLDGALVGVPWELLHDGDDFLVRRHRLGRLVTLDDPLQVALKRSMDPPLSVLIVADPCGDLPSARDEAAELAALLDDQQHFGEVTVLAGDVTVRAFRDALGAHDVLHFAGHAVAAGATGLRFADGMFPAELFGQLRGQIDFPGLVFLNACGSSNDTVRLSAGDDPLSGVSGIAASLLLCGVRHFVGTLWEVRDDVARLFATTFYAALGQGESVGRAMAAGRDALSERHGDESLFWADYLLYGDPAWALGPSGNVVDRDFAVLEGLERTYRSELASEDAGTRLLAAAMLLRLGDRSALEPIGRDLGELERWMAPDAPDALRRRAGLVVGALAAAAGMRLEGVADELPTPAAVRDLHARLTRP